MNDLSKMTLVGLARNFAAKKMANVAAGRRFDEVADELLAEIRRRQAMLDAAAELYNSLGSRRFPSTGAAIDFVSAYKAAKGER